VKAERVRKAGTFICFMLSDVVGYVLCHLRKFFLIKNSFLEARIKEGKKNKHKEKKTVTNEHHFGGESVKSK
jgi:hypothetical protein